METALNNNYRKLWDIVAEDLQIAAILETVVKSPVEEKALFEELKYFYPDKKIPEYRQHILTDMLTSTDLVDFFINFRNKLTELHSLYTMDTFEKFPHTQKVKPFLIDECFIELMDQTIKEADFLPRYKYSRETNAIIDAILDDEKVEYFKTALEKVTAIREELNEISPVKINRLFSRSENIENSITTSVKGRNLMNEFDTLIEKLDISPVEREVRTEFLFPPTENTFEAYLRAYKDIFAKVFAFAEEYSDLFDESWFILLHEVNTLLGFTKFYKNLKILGLPICAVKFVDKDKSMLLHNMYSVLLLKNGLEARQIVCSDYICNPDTHYNLLTGPNGGGKTIFLTSMGLCQMLFQTSGYTTAGSAEMFPLSYLYTHFPVEERNDSKGRLYEEQARCDKMIAELTDNAMVLLNETFSSTKAEIAHDLSTKLIEKLIEKDCFGVFVTHFHSVKEFCTEFSQSSERKICLLVAAVDDNVEGRRLYKIVPLESANTSYSRDILFRHRMTREQLLERCRLKEV